MNIISIPVRLALVVVLGIQCPATAQTLYRCGSSYQDQPCNGTQPVGSVIGGSARPASSSSQSADAANAANGVAPGAAISDSRCRQSGVDAEKLRWGKEAGRTLQQALEANAGNAAFIQDVYGRRGTAAEVRGAVEQACNAEQQRALEAARLNAAAAAIAAGSSATRSVSPSSGAPSSADGSSGTRH